MENMTEVLRSILQEELKPLKKDIQSLKEGQKRIDRAVEEIRLSTSRIDTRQPYEVMNILERMDLKLDRVKVDMDYISGKQGKQELEIHRLNKLVHSNWDESY